MVAGLTAEARLKGFIAKFDAKHQTLLRAVRRELRKRFPTATELVYDNYNFLVIGYSPTERPSDAILSIAAGANGISLCFLHGARLPDAGGILQGSGTQNRFIRLEVDTVLKQPDVTALIALAAAQAKGPMTGRGRGKLIIRSVSAKQRPRRQTAKGKT
jgi:hypothetical protein